MPIQKLVTSNYYFRVLISKWQYLFLTTLTSIFFDQLLISVNLYQHAKNQAFSSFCSWDTVDLKILRSDWLRAFWPICQEPDFSQVWDLCQNTAVNINFLYKPNSEKLMTKFSNKFIKPYFWPIFPISRAKIFFPKNPALSCTTPHWPLTPCWISEKN